MAKKHGNRTGPGRSGKTRDIPLPSEQPTRAECSACKGTLLVPLAIDGIRQRFQCANEDCRESFWLPIELARTVPRLETVADNLMGSNIVPPCPKCGKPYTRAGAWRERHVAKCDGTPPAAAAPRPAKPAPEALEAEDRGPSLKKRVVSFIRKERDHHTSQADVGRRLIDAIAEVKEDGE